MILSLLQAASDGHTAKDLAVPLATLCAVIVQTIAAHFKGRKRDRNLGAQLDARLAPVKQSVDALVLDVRDLRAYVVGPDGQNGLRGDHAELKARVDNMEERERERLERKVVAYDRRVES